jgi:hypothetical protein
MHTMHAKKRCRICGHHRNRDGHWEYPVAVTHSEPLSVLARLFSYDDNIAAHPSCLKKLGLDRSPPHDAWWWVVGDNDESVHLSPLMVLIDKKIRALVRTTATASDRHVLTLCDRAANMVASEFAFVEPFNPHFCADTLERFARFRTSAFHAPPTSRRRHRRVWVRANRPHGTYPPEGSA